MIVSQKCYLEFRTSISNAGDTESSPMRVSGTREAWLRLFSATFTCQMQDCGLASHSPWRLYQTQSTIVGQHFWWDLNFNVTQLKLIGHTFGWRIGVTHTLTLVLWGQKASDEELGEERTFLCSPCVPGSTKHLSEEPKASKIALPKHILPLLQMFSCLWYQNAH